MTATRRLLMQTAPLGFIAAVISAGCATTSTGAREIDAQAEPVFKQMCDTLDGAKAFRVRVKATMDREVDTGQLAQFHRASDITMVRPDQLHVEVGSDDGEWTAWYRGKTLTVLDRETNAYATETVPGSVGEMLDYMVDNYDLVMPMADLLVGETYDSLLAEVEMGSYVGLHAVDGRPCHHLLFRQENLNWQIWIDAGEPPVPRKLVITFTQDLGQPEYVATMDEWDLAPAIPAKAFRFTPPAGATSVTMSELVTED